MHTSAEAVTIGWMIPSGTNSLPPDEQSEYDKKYSQLKYFTSFLTVWFILWINEIYYGRVVCEFCIMEHMTSTQKMVAYEYIWVYINCTTQQQLIIPPLPVRWKSLMTVLDSLQIHWILHCHYQFKFKKNHNNAMHPNTRNFGIYISFAYSNFPKFQKIK